MNYYAMKTIVSQLQFIKVQIFEFVHIRFSLLSVSPLNYCDELIYADGRTKISCEFIDCIQFR